MSIVEQAKHKSVSFVNLGLSCQGPLTEPDHLIRRKCPGNIMIDLDTARFYHKRTKLVLGGRCIACNFYRQLEYFLKKYGIDLQEENSECTFDGCSQVALHRSGRCTRHLKNLLIKGWRAKATMHFQSFQESFKHASRKQWIFPPHYQETVRQRIKGIQQGKRSGAGLVILDTEFSPASSQIWEFAFIERVSGRILVNTIVNHEKGVKHNGLIDQPYLQWMSKLKGDEVYNLSRTSNIGRLNVHEIASKIQTASITPNTIVPVYHKSAYDLRILRQFLESAGYSGILPSNENCIPLLQLLRPNLQEVLPGGVKVSLALEHLFPIMYPRSELVGLNHQALIDCQQTRLDCMAFDELCKPIEDRGEEWNPGTVSRPNTASILEWLKSAHTSENHLGEVHDSKVKTSLTAAK